MGWFSPPAVQKGDTFEITSTRDFEKAVFTVSKYEDGQRTKERVTLADLNLKEGALVTCLGKGGGGHPAFCVSVGEAWKGIKISMTFLADGKPESYGLQKVENPNIKRIDYTIFCP